MFLSEKDLGVIVTSDMKNSHQCQVARKKGLKMLGILNRNVHYKSKMVIKRLYSAYVRPHLEYCVEAWHPTYKKDLVSLERVQRRATKMVRGIRNLSYEDRLKELKLQSLHHRRLRQDMITLFKILRSGDVSDLKRMFAFNDRKTRGHSLKLKKGNVNTLHRQNFFSQRVINEWNALPEIVVTCLSMHVFKKKLDKYYREKGIIYKID